MNKCETPEMLKKIFELVDQSREKFIGVLTEAVAIKSMSSDPEQRPEVFKMIDWAEDRLKNLGFTVERKEVESSRMSNGQELASPDIILAQLGTSEVKKTLVIYTHVDVVTAVQLEGWDSDPWVLSERGHKLYGRGSSDCKGPFVAWILAFECFKATGEDVPVNIKIIVDGMEEVGSLGMFEVLCYERNKFFRCTDFVCICDYGWLVTKKPTLIYGLRGLCYFYIEVEGGKRDLHSGTFGGALYEAMADLVYLLDSLVNEEGAIIIPGINECVQPVRCYEREEYANISFDVDKFKDIVGADRLTNCDDSIQVLMHMWRFPALTIHGIEGAHSGQGNKTVIPKKVIGKFSIRIVPDQEPKMIEKLVLSYINGLWCERGSPNRMKVTMKFSTPPFLEDPEGPNYCAGIQANQYVYGCTPDLVREGGSLPVANKLKEITGASVLILPIGCIEDGTHSQNESIRLKNFIEGIKVLSAYLFSIATV